MVVSRLFLVIIVVSSSLLSAMDKSSTDEKRQWLVPIAQRVRPSLTRVNLSAYSNRQKEIVDFSQIAIKREQATINHVRGLEQAIAIYRETHHELADIKPMANMANSNGVNQTTEE